ncbi:unnamed protein product [Brassica rapa]|uniref:Uncharacterized protein n=1 Tax=Brassica campestris TaxID=3711 RepID=A0A3P6AFG7_BRACM|nr:unnamed protein product [Brassica rapa]VDC82961.1 unnamed protein product [Brassica rapa]
MSNVKFRHFHHSILLFFSFKTNLIYNNMFFFYKRLMGTNMFFLLFR